MKKQTLRRFSKISCILLTGLLLCSCSTPVEVAEPTDHIISVESEAERVDAATGTQVYEAIRKEEHDEPGSTPETENLPVITASPDIEIAAVIVETASKPTKAPVAVTPLPTATAEPTASPTATPLPKVNESESTATPKPTSPPTATPTAQSTVLPTEKPLLTAAPVSTIAPTATPKPTATPSSTVAPTPTPIPTAVPKIEEVWIVDVPGHYETVEEVTEIWVDEQGHWEESGYWASDWVFECNQCGMQYSMEEAVNQHLDDSFDWDTMTGHSSYTQVSGPMYWVETEPEWVVDVPGHYETVTESKEVWIDEQGHWETVTT